MLPLMTGGEGCVYGTPRPDKLVGTNRRDKSAGVRRAVLAAALTAVAALGGVVAQASAKVPYFKHVFVVVLENENASTTFGPNSQAPYLAQTLKNKGAYVPNYYGIAHNSLGNYVAMVSGQSPNIQTQADCQVYNDITPGTRTAGGQVLGTGCIYPPGVQTVGNQLGQAGYQWKGYMEDMNANAPKGGQSPCRHPAIGEKDPWQKATPTDEYATRHNPFVYFHSLIDFKRTCAQHDVDYSHLRHDLKHWRDVPQLRVDRSRPVQRRPRRPVRERAARRSRLGQPLVAPADARDPALLGLQAPRTPDRDLRRGRGKRIRGGFQRLLRRAARTEHRASQHPGLPDPRTGRRAGRRRDGLTLHQARDGEQEEVQPLFAAPLRGEKLPAAVPGLRGTGRIAIVWQRHLHPAQLLKDIRPPLDRGLPCPVTHVTRLVA